MSEQQPRVIESKEIMTLLPHRYPFLLVDRVLDFKEGEWLKAIKNISVNEPCFTGHFKRPVLPGDQMELNVQVIKERRGITAFTGVATVNGEIACEAKLMCARR